MGKVVEAFPTDGRFVGGEKCLWHDNGHDIRTSCLMAEPSSEVYKDFIFCPWCGNEIMHTSDFISYE